MLVTFFRTLIIFSVLLVLMRLMGKRQIGEMQPFEFIVTLIIADLACIPITDVSIPLIYGVVAIVCLFILHQLLSILEHCGNTFKKIISGKPSIVINRDGINIHELKKNNLSIDDLIESMRAAGYFTFDDLSYAIYESNGKLSALENEEKEPHPSSIPLLVINDGKIVDENLFRLGKTFSQLNKFLKVQNTETKKVEVMTVDGQGRTYFKNRKQKFKILSFPLGEDIKW